MIDVGQGVTVIFETAGWGFVVGGVVGGVDGPVVEFPEHAAVNKQATIVSRFMRSRVYPAIGRGSRFHSREQHEKLLTTF